MRHFTSIFLYFSLGLFFSINTATVHAQCSDLFISEYVEGSGNNKCLEIFNPTAASIDLAAGNYDINRYSNGSSNASVIPLTGSIPTGGTYVICHSSATSSFTSVADQLSSQANWNGDDAISLTKDNGATVLDIFGEIGTDPGSQWSAGGNSTKNHTLRRNAAVTGGNTTNAAGFPTLGTEWTQFASNTSNGLGSHTSDNCPPAVSGCDKVFISEYVEGSSNNKCLEIFNPTAAAIDLAAGNYDINRYSNGSSNATVIPLTGSIPAGGTYVICHSSSSSSFTSVANQLSGQINWNGDDAISLSKDNGATVLDIFGEIGVDPGSKWSVGGNTTQNHTLRRNADVTEGNTTNAAGFPTLGTEWTQYASNTSNGLGSHTSDCMPQPTGCTITSVTIMNDGVCDDNGTIDPSDDTFTATVHIEFSNLPASGKVGIGGDVLRIRGVDISTIQNNTLDEVGTFQANGQTITLTVTVYDDNGIINCQLTEQNAGTAMAPCSVIPDCEYPFFSEYMEGSGNNKCIEVYNPTASTIDLAADGYYVSIFFNGSSNAGQTIPLTGAVLAGGTYVLCNNNTDNTFLTLSDQQSGALAFNGDDAVVLGDSDNVLDIIGQIGFDPGTNWSSNGVGTRDMTIRRKSSVLSGDNFGADAFDPSAEWDAYDQNTYLGFGSHGSDCGGVVIPSGPWNSLSVNCEQANTSTYDAVNDEWDVIANCTSNTFHKDAYAFLAQPSCGDFSISVKIEGTSGVGQGGLMIRENITPQSKYVWLAQKSNGSLVWAWRSATYGATQQIYIPFFGLNWLKIERTGNTYTGFASYDGTNWYSIGALTFPMDNCPLAGFAVESFNYSPAIFTISNLTLTPATSALVQINDETEMESTALDIQELAVSELPKANTSINLSEVTLFPNPAGEWLNINLPTDLKESGIIQLLDTNGKLILTQDFDDSNGMTNINLGKLNIPSGMYIVRIQTANQSINKQFIKQ